MSLALLVQSGAYELVGIHQFESRTVVANVARHAEIPANKTRTTKNRNVNTNQKQASNAAKQINDTSLSISIACALTTGASSSTSRSQIQGEQSCGVSSTIASSIVTPNQCSALKWRLDRAKQLPILGACICYHNVANTNNVTSITEDVVGTIGRSTTDKVTNMDGATELS